MKKLYLLFLITTTFCFSQNIHPIPSHLTGFYNPSTVTNPTLNDPNIISRIDTLISNLDAGGGFHETNGGVNSTYFSKRILAHIQLYYYYTNEGDASKANDQKVLIEFFFGLLLDEQCISYSAQTECTFEHGGFPANYGNVALRDDLNANPLPTALALKVFAQVRDLYDNLGMSVPIISCDEFEDRVYQAKHALYTYQQINYQYINLTSFTQMAATSIHQLYDDAWSMDFLIEKATELLYKTGDLRPFESGDLDWQRSWEEGQQADGSWKDYGAVYVVGNSFLSADGTLLDLNECQKWHDSELDYHATITEGLAHLYHTLESGELKDKTKDHLLASINHIIDYNEVTEFLENPFNNAVIEDTGTVLNNDYAQTRLTGTGRITKYHRELASSECPGFNYSKRVVGIGFVRSLIFSKNYIETLLPNDHDILDQLISGLVIRIILAGPNNIPVDQLYDLSLFLNRNNLNEIQKNRSKDKAIAAFKFDPTNTATIVSHKENTTLTLDFNEDIYSHTQEAVDMIAGDFNGNGF